MTTRLQATAAEDARSKIKSLEERAKMLSLTNETHRKDLQMAQAEHAAALVALAADKEVRECRTAAPRFASPFSRRKALKGAVGFHMNELQGNETFG